MPKLEEALYEYLTGEPQVSAIVDDRVYPLKLPERVELPAITWRRVSATRIYTHDLFEDTDPWVTARIQVDCWAESELEMVELGEAVLAVLSGYDGMMGGALIGSSFAVNELEFYEQITKVHRRTLDFQISYEDDVAEAS